MAFGDYLSEFEAIVAEFEDFLREVWENDLELVEIRERELRAILFDLRDEVDYIGIGPERRVRSTAKTKAATRKARSRIVRWQAATLAAMRANNPAEFLEARKLAEVRRAFRLGTSATRRLLRRLSNQERFTRAQVAQAKDLSRSLKFVRQTYGDSLETYFDGLISEAEFGKVENLAGGVIAGVREPLNFIARWTAGNPAGSIGITRVREEVLSRAMEAQTRDDIANFVADWKLNRNQLRLSSIAHLRGIFNSTLIRLFQGLGVAHFMFYVPREHRPRSRGMEREYLYSVRVGSPDGTLVDPDDLLELVSSAVSVPPAELRVEVGRRSKLAKDRSPSRRREILARLLTSAEKLPSWPEVFRKVSEGRNSTVPWASNLTIHPGSRETFLPVPPALLGEARAWSESTRGRMTKAAA